MGIFLGEILVEDKTLYCSCGSAAIKDLVNQDINGTQYWPICETCIVRLAKTIQYHFETNNGIMKFLMV